MPTYNSEKYLYDCLNSLTTQSLSNFELIIVDDGSSDNTLKILKNYANKDCRISIYKQHHKYAGTARNYGLDQATGEYILFLDSDDIFDENLLEHSAKQLKKANADVCVFGSKFLNNTTGEISNESTLHLDKCPNNDAFNRYTNSRYLFQFTSPAPWTKLFKRSFILENNLKFQEIRSANDISFTYTALALANKITVLNEPLVTYRRQIRHSLQSSQQIKPYSFYLALKHLKNELEDRKLYNSLRSTYLNSAVANCIYNLHTLSAFPKTQEEIFYFLQTEGLKELDISNKPISYYYGHSKKRMREFFCLEKGSYEEFLELSNKHLTKSVSFSLAQRKKLKKQLRKILPLRASVFEKKHREIINELSLLHKQIEVLTEENRNLNEKINQLINIHTHN